MILVGFRPAVDGCQNMIMFHMFTEVRCVSSKHGSAPSVLTKRVPSISCEMRHEIGIFFLHGFGRVSTYRCSSCEHVNWSIFSLPKCCDFPKFSARAFGARKTFTHVLAESAPKNERFCVRAFGRFLTCRQNMLNALLACAYKYIVFS